MGKDSRIEWTDHTFNSWIGCQKVSPGCQHCYAESLMDHRYGKVKWGPVGTRQRTSVTNWRKPLEWNKQAKAEGRRYRVFCASLADVFENNSQLLDWRQDLFDLINQTPNLDWLLLTKRPQHVFDFVPPIWLGGLPPNVWLGTSVENQEQADKRIPELLKVPASVRFLSMEPLLGPVDFEYESNVCHCGDYVEGHGYSQGHTAVPMMDSYLRDAINWVIVGGESGQKARPMQTEWALDIRRQCKADGVSFFMKQLGGHPDKRHDMVNFPPELRVREFPRS